MAATKDFSRFNSIDYLEEYYSAEGKDPENNFLLGFFHDVYSHIPQQKKLLEVGGGPSIYPLISASSKVDEIMFSEYTEDNRAAVKAWIDKLPTAFDWGKHFSYVADMEGEPSPEKIEERVRKGIKKVVACDITKNNPLHPLMHKGFDIVSVNFCPEGITDDEKSYAQYIKNIAYLLKPKGLMVMTLLRNARYYNAGDTKYAACPVDENSVSDVLKNVGCRITRMRTIDIDAPERGYDGIIALTAVKQ
jgi:hypothetical protein